MILRRLSANLRAQNWTAIALELAIVVIGVFVGTQVANWNEARLQRAATEKMLVRFAPELKAQVDFFDNAQKYYRTSRGFADQALAAWNGDPKITDEQFVIAAYQATQIIGLGLNAENWTSIFGGQQLSDIEDEDVRRKLELILTQDYGPVQFGTVATPYREQVRRIIPIRIQDLIRGACGDRNISVNGAIYTALPPSCSLRLPPGEAKSIAAALRARGDLADELNWHLAAVTVYLANAEILAEPIRELHREMAEKS